MSLRVGLLSCLLLVTATAGVNGGRHGDPLWKPNMGSYSMPITTASAECQSRFDLGVLCEFNFNQGFAQAQFNASLDAGFFLFTLIIKSLYLVMEVSDSNVRQRTMVLQTALIMNLL